MIKIQMLDDDGLVKELVEKVHVCIGDDSPEGCMYPASCNDCYDDAVPSKPVYVWTTAMGIDYFACGTCISLDKYVHLINVE